MKICSVDIGLKGCGVITDESFLRPIYVDNLDQMLSKLSLMMRQEGVRVVVMEEPLSRPNGGGVSKGFTTTWFNFGRLHRELETVKGVQFIERVAPITWQAPIKQGKKEDKQFIADYLLLKYPHLQHELYHDNGTLNDGRSDALAIADWWFEKDRNEKS